MSAKPCLPPSVLFCFEFSPSFILVNLSFLVKTLISRTGPPAHFVGVNYLLWRNLPHLTGYRLPISCHRSFFFRTRSFKTELKLINNITFIHSDKISPSKLLGCRDGVFRPAWCFLKSVKKLNVHGASPVETPACWRHGWLWLGPHQFYTSPLLLLTQLLPTLCLLFYSTLGRTFLESPVQSFPADVSSKRTAFHSCFILKVTLDWKLVQRYYAL